MIEQYSINYYVAVAALLKINSADKLLKWFDVMFDSGCILYMRCVVIRYFTDDNIQHK